MSHVFIDLRTLSFVLMVVTGLMAVVMALIWRTQRAYPGVGLWALSNLSAAIGFLFIALRGTAPDFVTVIVGNTLAVGTLALAYEGNRAFFGLNQRYLVTGAVLALHGAAVGFFNYVVPDLFLRIVAASSASIVFAAMSVAVFYHARHERKSIPYRVVGATYLVFMLMMTVRIGATGFYSTIGDELFTPDWIQSLFFMMFIVVALVWTFNYVILNNERLHEDLREAEEELKTLATTDYLTGLSNNRAFFDFAAVELKRSRRHGIPLTLVVFDVDHFKRINDTYGHAAGDLALKAIGEHARSITRENDIVARLGGEEFGILLTHTDIDRGRLVADSMRVSIAGLDVPFGDIRLSFTASFGVAELRPNEQIGTLLARADANLYEAKHGGRNRVVSEPSEKRLRLVAV